MICHDVHGKEVNIDVDRKRKLKNIVKFKNKNLKPEAQYTVIVQAVYEDDRASEGEKYHFTTRGKCPQGSSNNKCYNSVSALFEYSTLKIPRIKKGGIEIENR